MLAVTLIIVFFPKGGDNAPVINSPISSNVFATENIQVSVTVIDDKGVSSVILSYSNDSKTSWHNVTMFGSGTTTWTGTGLIPPQDIETVVYYKIYAKDTANQWVLNDNNSNCFRLYTGSRKAFIVGSANDFYGNEVEDEFNNGFDSNFSQDTGNWILAGENIVGGQNPALPGLDGYLGVAELRAQTAGYVKGNLTYIWTDHYSLVEYAYYNITAWIQVNDAITGIGARIGLQWIDSSGKTVRIDWSENFNTSTSPNWLTLNSTGPCNNQTNNEITRLALVLSVDGTMGVGNVLFDNIKIERWITVNVSYPFDPNPPPNPRTKNCDGFPAQALQVYKILKAHGYSDENIFFMLYYKNDADGVIDILAGDGIPNDLDATVQIDVANDSITANRVKQELNVSVSGSFASSIQSNDQLIIFMTDHGSNAQLSDKNATFHFEADQSFITEFEFFALVSQIDCWRMMINLDCCFSGNFLNQNGSIGSSWYNLTNCIFVSAAANVLSWYWIDNNNGDLFAGSWFFHVFWDQLDKNQTIGQAYTFAQAFIPARKGNPLALIQAPLLQDNLGIQNSWSFTSFSKL